MQYGVSKPCVGFSSVGSKDVENNVVLKMTLFGALVRHVLLNATG